MESPVFEPSGIMLQRLALALAVGLFVGMEREHNRKEAGLRTFAFVAVIGGLGGMLGGSYAVLALVFTGLLVVLLGAQTLTAGENAEITTSAALFVTVFAGILAGKGLTVLTAALAVITAALLAWKKPLAVFSQTISGLEVRSAILLAMLAFVIYPMLPVGSVDPWGLIVPRTAWITVILMAALGFVNYVLLKIFSDRGVLLTGFLGGLVNSKVASIEMATRSRNMGGRLIDAAYRGIILTNGAMILRNVVVLIILAPTSVVGMTMPFVLMLSMSALVVFQDHLPAGYLRFLIPARQKSEVKEEGDESEAQPLEDIPSPFSIGAAIQFGVMFMIIQVVSTIALRELGEGGLFAVAIIGGIISSVGAVASIANLAAQGEIAGQVATMGVVMTTVSSLLFCIPFVSRFGRDPRLSRTVAFTIIAIAGVGVLASVAQVLIVGFK